MNIQQLQKLINSDERAMSPDIKQRIMDNKMTMRDINFMEKNMMSAVLFRMKYDLELLVPSFQEAWMTVKEHKNNGETEIDIDYVLNVLNDTAELFVELQEQTDDFGLAGVVAVDEPKQTEE